MATFILTWNPRRWSWEDLDREAVEIRAGRRVTRMWSTGNTRNVKPGDRLFLLKQGESPTGFVATGTAASAVSDLPHHDPAKAARGETALRVLVEFDAIENPRLRRPLGPAEVSDPLRSSIKWNAAASGFELENHAAAQLEAAWREHLTKIPADLFDTSKVYTREGIHQLLGLEPITGGNWFTGYHKHDGEWFLFPTIGGPGRTGHNYDNRWEGQRLRWWGKTDSHIGQPSVQDLLASGSRVRLFTRDDSRAPFTYHGLVRPAEVTESIPILVLWESVHEPPAPPIISMPGEIEPTVAYREGRLRQVVVNVYERSPQARRQCIDRWGTSCAACGLDMGSRYGDVAEGFIHVHHLNPLAARAAEYEVDPVNDLRPLCPNCHGVTHLKEPPFTIDEVRRMLRSL